MHRPQLCSPMTRPSASWPMHALRGHGSSPPPTQRLGLRRPTVPGSDTPLLCGDPTRMMSGMHPCSRHPSPPCVHVAPWRRADSYCEVCAPRPTWMMSGMQPCSTASSKRAEKPSPEGREVEEPTHQRYGSMAFRTVCERGRRWETGRLSPLHPPRPRGELRALCASVVPCPPPMHFAKLITKSRNETCVPTMHPPRTKGLLVAALRRPTCRHGAEDGSGQVLAVVSRDVVLVADENAVL